MKNVLEVGRPGGLMDGIRRHVRLWIASAVLSAGISIASLILMATHSPNDIRLMDGFDSRSIASSVILLLLSLVASALGLASFVNGISALIGACRMNTSIRLYSAGHGATPLLVSAVHELQIIRGCLAANAVLYSLSMPLFLLFRWTSLIFGLLTLVGIGFLCGSRRRLSSALRLNNPGLYAAPAIH